MELKYLPEKEIVIHEDNWSQVATITKILTDNMYAVMVTREEDLIIINYVHADDILNGCNEANRNNVIFLNRDEFDWQLEDYEDKVFKEQEEYIMETLKIKKELEERPEYFDDDEVDAEEGWEESEAWRSYIATMHSPVEIDLDKREEKEADDWRAVNYL